LNIILILVASFGLSFFIAYIYTARQLKVTTQHLAETILLYLSSEENKSENTENKVDADNIHKESFIKFLSDSRDWAFDYIEQTQKTISKFIEEVEPHIEYYNNYGTVVDGIIPPHDKALKKISVELSLLKKLLPEDPNDRR